MKFLAILSLLFINLLSVHAEAETNVITNLMACSKYTDEVDVCITKNSDDGTYYTYRVKTAYGDVEVSSKNQYENVNAQELNAGLENLLMGKVQIEDLMYFIPYISGIVKRDLKNISQNQGRVTIEKLAGNIAKKIASLEPTMPLN